MQEHAGLNKMHLACSKGHVPIDQIRGVRTPYYDRRRGSASACHVALEAEYLRSDIHGEFVEPVNDAFQGVGLRDRSIESKTDF
jgi:hypothetical protein